MIAVAALEMRKRIRARKKKRGVALIMVLAAITVLTVFLTELQEQTSAELSSAFAERDALKAEYHARSAVNLSRMLIATEPAIRRSIAPLFLMLKKPPPQIPVWEFSDMVLGPFNDAIGTAAFGALAGLDTSTGKNLGLEGGSFIVKIVDEDAKININAAASGVPGPADRLGGQLLQLMASQEYNPLFEGRDADDQFSDRATICGAIVDWTDPDENLYPCNLATSGPASGGAEDNFYQTIGLDYRRKNAPYDSLEELRLVRGVTDDFWATFVDPDPSNPAKRTLTVWGRDKINVNSANAQTLLALACFAAADGTELCSDVEQMAAFISGVTMAKSFTMGAPLFTSPKQFTSTLEGKNKTLSPLLAAVGVKPIVFKSKQLVESAIDVTSKIFSIYAEGVVPPKGGGNGRTTRVRVHTVVDFSTAEALGAASPGLPGGKASGPSGADDEPANTAPTSAATPEAIAASLAANPAGTIVYWRVE